MKTDDLQYLKSRASGLWKSLNTVLGTLNKNYRSGNAIWGINEETGEAEQFDLPQISWEEFGEPDEPLFDEREQEFYTQR